MQLSATTLLRTKSKPTRGLPKPGDRVTIAADVLRVLAGDERPLLIHLEGNGQKLTIRSADIPGGAKLRGSDKVRLGATVTRVGESEYVEFTPISMAVDGWSASRVTMSARSVQRPK